MKKKWVPPGKNCGLCGVKTCGKFLILVGKNERRIEDCVFYGKKASGKSAAKPAKGKVFKNKDVLGNAFDFVLDPLPGEVSARKIVQPFCPDIVRKWKIKKGDIVVGRPQNAGCPVQHVLKVINANYTTGVLDTWCVGPKYSRGAKTHDIESYNMIGFEGLAGMVKRPPEFGHRQKFLPGFCMMNFTHTGVVNMVLNKSCGTHVRIEDIRFL